MALALRDAGIPHLRQLCSSDPDEIDRWLADNGLLDQPVVVKPPRSAATDNVHFVPTGAQWRPFFDQVYRQVNCIGLVNEAVLVQELATGTEFMIDSYSADGKHGLVDVCRYTKLQKGDRIGIYDLVDFLPPDDTDVVTVWAYAQRVLDVLGVRNGCAHTEVMLTPDGPRLLEVGVRPAGGGHQMISELATGSNHIMRTVAHRVFGEFQESYELVRHVCSVVISAPEAGIWRNPEVFDGVESLPGFHMKHFYFGGGDQLPAPAGLSSMVGWVVLATPDRDTLVAGYRHIKELERQMQVDPAAATDDVKVLTELNEQFIEAFRQGSWELLEPILSPGFQYLNGKTGEVTELDEYRANLRANPVPALSIDQVVVHVDGDGAVVSARTSRVPGTFSRYVDSYVRRGDRWVCVQACVWPLA
jgi:hypothetical protein